MSLYKKMVLTSASEAWKGLLNSIGAGKDRPYVAGKRVSATLDFGTIDAQEHEDLTIACPGAKIGNIVEVGGPAPAAGSFYSGHVAEADVVTVRCNNYSSGQINPDSGVFTCIVVPNA